jgi:hypothetical protein
MQFSDLTNSIQDVWFFAWPPLVLCCIAYVISRYLHPDGTLDALRQWVARAREYGLKIEAARGLLEPYGLTKLVPVISVVAFVGFMYLLNSPMTDAVSNLPPHLSVQPGLLIAESMSEDDCLLLLRTYPASRSLDDAYSLALVSAKPESKGLPQMSDSGLWEKSQSFIKFAFVVSLVTLIVSLKAGLPVGGQLAKFLLMFLLLTSLWVASVAGLLYKLEHQFYQEWWPIHLALQKDAGSRLTAPITDEERARIAAKDGQRWWRVYVLDPYLWTWAKRTIFSIQPPK